MLSYGKTVRLSGSIMLENVRDPNKCVKVKSGDDKNNLCNNSFHSDGRAGGKCLGRLPTALQHPEMNRRAAYLHNVI